MNEPAKLSEDEFKTKVWQIISLIPAGRVITYGTIAKLADLPNRARHVGRIMRELPKDTSLPWHRVINAAGAIAIRSGAGTSLQKQRLEQEGLRFHNNRVDLKHYGWPDDKP